MNSRAQLDNGYWVLAIAILISITVIMSLMNLGVNAEVFESASDEVVSVPSSETPWWAVGVMPVLLVAATSLVVAAILGVILNIRRRTRSET